MWYVFNLKYKVLSDDYKKWSKIKYKWKVAARYKYFKYFGQLLWAFVCICWLMTISLQKNSKEGSACRVTSLWSTSTVAGGVRWPAADPPVSWLPNRTGGSDWVEKQGFLSNVQLIIALSRTWDWDRGARPPFSPLTAAPEIQYIL